MRLDWPGVAPHVRDAVERELGAPVVEAATQPEGFSPALAARIRAENGRRAFVKAVPPDANPDSPAIYRKEIRVMAKLPAGLPVPRLLWSLDEGPGGWVVLMFEELEAAHPALPWREEDLRLALRSLEVVAATECDLPPAGEWMARHWSAWQVLAADPPPGLDGWSSRHAERLARLEMDLPAAVAGDSLVHLDVRWDNLLIDARQAWLVDWPWACRGAPWLDAVFFAPSVELQGGPPAAELLERFGPARTAPREAVVCAAAALAGMLTDRALRPAPPGLPTLRPFQAAFAATFRGFVGQLTGWR